MQRGAVALALVALALRSPAAAGQPADWQPLGPEGASILTLASAPGAPETLYAGGFAALFRSTDGGATWGRIGGGVAALRDIGALHVDAGGALYVGTFGAGVYRSTDGGTGFVAANLGLASASIFALLEDAGGALWAGTVAEGVFVSTDGGESWENRSSGLADLEVHDLLAVGADSLYAATAGGVCLSTDAGASWNARSQGLGNLKTVSLARRPGGPYLYAGTTTTTTEESGVYRSSDGGESWTLVATGLTNTRIADLLVDPTNPDVLLAATQTAQVFSESGIYRSTNAGASWALLPGSPSARDVRVLAAVGATVFAGAVGEATTRGGVFRAADGQTFTRSDRGLVVMRCRAVTSHRGLPDELLVGAAGTFREPGGAYRSLDGGETWQEHSAEGLRSTVHALRIVTPRLRFAGTSGGVWRWSATEGGVWHQTALSTGVVQDLAPGLALEDSLRLWAATSIGVYYSSDGGTNFFARSSGLTRTNVRAIVLAPGVPDLAFAGTDSAGVFRSTSGGAAWELWSAGLGSLDVRDLAFDGAGRLFAATAGGVFELGGDTWVERSSGLAGSARDVRGLAIYRDERFAATAGGVFRLAGDPGAGAWEAWSAGLPLLDVRAVHADTARGRLRVFAATEGAGLFAADEPVAVELTRFEAVAAPGRVELRFSTAWEEDHLGFHVERRLAGEPGFERRTARFLAGGPDYVYVDEDLRLRAGFDVEYRLVAVSRSGAEESFPPLRVTIPAAGPAGSPASPASLAVRPSPFGQAAWLAVAGGRGGAVRIWDVAGRLVRTLPVEADGLLAWDGLGERGAGVAAGLYVFRLEGPGGSATARAVKLK